MIKHLSKHHKAQKINLVSCLSPVYGAGRKIFFKTLVSLLSSNLFPILGYHC